jgi:hypothetical protein
MAAVGRECIWRQGGRSSGARLRLLTHATARVSPWGRHHVHGHQLRSGSCSTTASSPHMTPQWLLASIFALAVQLAMPAWDLAPPCSIIVASIV